MSRVVVLRLTGTERLEGLWREIPSGPAPVAYRQRPEQQPPAEVTFVATGSVEWNGNRCAEVWVPADKLGLWRAEHDLDTES